jgi:hypothetical protein
VRFRVVLARVVVFIVCRCRLDDTLRCDVKLVGLLARLLLGTFCDQVNQVNLVLIVCALCNGHVMIEVCSHNIFL